VEGTSDDPGPRVPVAAPVPRRDLRCPKVDTAHSSALRPRPCDHPRPPRSTTASIRS